MGFGDRFLKAITPSDRFLKEVELGGSLAQKLGGGLATLGGAIAMTGAGAPIGGALAAVGAGTAAIGSIAGGTAGLVEGAKHGDSEQAIGGMVQGVSGGLGLRK